MTDARRRQPAVDKPPHAVPGDAAVLAAARQGAMPEPAHLVAEQLQAPGRSWARHNSGQCPPTTDAQPSALLRDGIVHAPSQLGFDLGQLRLQPLAHGLAQDRETSRCFASSRRCA